MAFGELLKKHRVKNHLSLRDLKEKSLVNISTLSKYENGSHLNLKRKTVSDLSRALELSRAEELEFFFSGGLIPEEDTFIQLLEEIFVELASTRGEVMIAFEYIIENVLVSLRKAQISDASSSVYDLLIRISDAIEHAANTGPGSRDPYTEVGPGDVAPAFSQLASDPGKQTVITKLDIDSNSTSTKNLEERKSDVQPRDKDEVDRSNF